MTTTLYIKPGCPWCDEAIDWLDSHDIAYNMLDVTNDPEARHQMRELTGQTKAPSIEVGDEVLADFGAEELEVWWKKMKFPL